MSRRHRVATIVNLMSLRGRNESRKFHSQETISILIAVFVERDSGVV